MTMLAGEWNESELYAMVEQLLRQLHISGTVKGFWYLRYSIVEVVKDRRKLELITKRLYMDAAKRFAPTASVGQIERAIRTAINQCWNRGGRPMLDKLVGYHLEERPSNREFMDYVAAHINRAA